MTSVDRNIIRHACGRTVVLFPGWATDGRIFDGLTLHATCLVPQASCVPDFTDQLAETLRETGPAVLIGWSIGGYVAAEFARACPDRIERLVLAGMRPRYPADEIAIVRQRLLEDKASCLTGFYRQCFLPAQKEDFRRFREKLLMRYIAELSISELTDALDYLAQAELSEKTLPPCPVTCIHGTQDVVAPVEAMRSLTAQLPQLQLREVANAGHAVFLHPNFPSFVWNDV